MSSTAPPTKQAKLSVNNNNNNSNNTNNQSFSAHGNVTSNNVGPLPSRNDEQEFLTKEERFIKEHYDYFNQTFTNLLMHRQAISESSVAQRKQLEEALRLQASLKNGLDQAKNDLQRRASECVKLTRELQEVRLQKDQLNQVVKQKDNEISSLQKQLTHIKDEMTKFYKRCLDINQNNAPNNKQDRRSN
ncbi:PREDICTED: uncharacterized protein DDB_G0277605-like [Wasmannia auropunctata]|uniref:uncharacterized protein DDB_G0277605-like n=1 Tax=Wasmannia auropunctata TaxID=64793 RepID=UPI0005ED8B82|nr:PREDICTED: uncharacterized protein DDB_G0277605-like [Wasmannia auropunctata]